MVAASIPSLVLCVSVSRAVRASCRSSSSLKISSLVLHTSSLSLYVSSLSLYILSLTFYISSLSLHVSRSLVSHVARLLISRATRLTSPMKAWTTPEQHAWLISQIPNWLGRRRKRGDDFLQGLVAKFLGEFTVPEADRPKLRDVSVLPSRSPLKPLTYLQRLQQWFYNHGKGADPPPPKPVVSSILTIKSSRRPAPLTRAQAYSCMHYTEGSELYTELRAAHGRYISGDKLTCDKYKHLFPGAHNPGMLLVTFQQAVLKEIIGSVSEEEVAEIEKYISDRYQKDQDLHERPWVAMRVNDSESDLDLERQYVTE
jgi:hypothetical protein